MTNTRSREQFIVIAQSPSVDVSQAVGPYSVIHAAIRAGQELASRGYNTEICPLVKLSDVDVSPAWGE